MLARCFAIVAAAALIPASVPAAQDDCGGALSAEQARAVVGKPVRSADGRPAGKVAMILAPSPGTHQRLVIDLGPKKIAVPADKVRPSDGSEVRIGMSRKQMEKGTAYMGGIKLDPSDPCGR